MTERTFTIHEACAATGITPVCLHQWIERDYIVPLHNPPSGARRHYTLSDIVHIAAMVELGMAGLPPVRAAEILGASPLSTVGRQTVVARRGQAEIRLDLAAVTKRVRSALL
ncbi:MAG: MerR family transcriptional regulator [Hyphomicrobium sp.]